MLLFLVCKDQRSDLIFLVDSSESIGPSDYQKMKDFMKAVVGKSAVGQNEVHVGVMQYSTSPQMEFQLNVHYTREDLNNAIDNLQQIGESTLTGTAIVEVSRYFDADRGGRPDVKRRLVVITDGESQDQVKTPAQELRKKGVLVYAIGVENANRTQLEEISGSKDRLFTERNFDGLKDLESKVSLEICDPKRGRKTRSHPVEFSDVFEVLASYYSSSIPTRLQKHREG